MDRIAMELVKVARDLVSDKVSLDELRGAVQFSPKYSGGKDFWVSDNLDAIFVRGPHKSEDFRSIRWRDRVMELRLKNAPQVVGNAFSRSRGSYGKLEKLLEKTGAFRIKRIASDKVAVKSDFTVIRPLQLKKDGATRDSLENARRIKDAGYDLLGGTFQYDRGKAEWTTKAYFKRAVDGSKASHVFKGFSFGYGGQGPRGMIEFLDIFEWGPSEKKIVTPGYWPDEKGTLRLRDLT